MSFLGQLADQINSQFSVGENQNHSLDAVVNGQNQKFGVLGDFSKKIDRSAQRNYVEEGYLRSTPFQADPKQREILMQEPNATILVKKRMFSSVAENFRPDFSSSEEKLYYKAIKILFQNKCRRIAALEKLSKIQKITSAVGEIDAQLVPIIISLADTALPPVGITNVGGLDSSGQPQASVFTKVVDRLRRLYGFNTANTSTAWITDPTNLFQSQFGQGTGVIEITNFMNLSTNISVDGIKNPGSCSFSISDPYESMLITEYDIEQALSDATNAFYNNKFFQFGQQSAEQAINDAQVRLNQLRSNRKASPISININPDTLLGRRVVVIIDRLGTELPFDYNSSSTLTGGTGVTVAPEYLKNGAVAGFEGLDTDAVSTFGPDSNIRKLVPDSELSTFQRLIASVFHKLTLDANSRNSFQFNNKLTNYARRKLRFNFNGKQIIQPMDVVHIYLSSKSRYDNKVLAGLKSMFTGVGILQNVNNTVVDFKNAADALFNPSGSLNLQLEKSTFVGSDFPNYLWSVLRTQFVTEKEGTHVFAGVVEGANDNWSDGRFTVDVRCRDNTSYFDQGKVNFKPGSDVFNGAIFDPLTPFKTNFDRITTNFKDDAQDLLDENKFLLGTSQDTDSPLVKFKLGPNAGRRATSDNYIQDREVDPTTQFINKIFYAPDGLVYKWKEGIGVFVQFGSFLDLNDPNKVGAPNIAKDPLAGQDVMNVLSLLITGQPYNFANYWRTVQNFDGAGKDPQSQQDSAYSYYAALRNDLVKNNALWGNFIPFKNLTIDEQSFAQALQSQFRIVQKNKDLDLKVQKLAELNQEANLLGAANVFSGASSDKISSSFLDLQQSVSQLTDQINTDIADIQKTDTSFIVQTGDDVSFDFNDFVGSGNDDKQKSDAGSRRLLRRKLNYLTRRMSYNVRANDDKNLFIVDDFYDKDYDIAAYNKALEDGLRLYNNEFTSVRDKIIATADLLNLEVFCDTQGHIRVRPPQYNRMPSSIFYRMMYLKNATGIQIFPQFLDDFFNDQINSLLKRLEVIEDQIRLDGAVLGYNDDSSVTQFILSNNATSGQGDSFGFISNSGGKISDMSGIMQAANPDQREDAQPQAISDFDKIKGQATSTKDIFTNAQRYSTIVEALVQQNLVSEGFSIRDISQFDVNTKIDELISRIQTKSGQKISRDNFITTTDLGLKDIEVPAGTTIDIFKVTKDLSDKIKERQKVLKLLFGAVKNAAEFKSLDDKNDTTTNQLLMPGIYGNSNIPEVFEHMIEDETYDDYGLGSGTRYIIKRSQIKNISISENPPDFTMVEVQGVLNPFAPDALPEGLNAFPDGGNGIVTAIAVDYDSWRNYGFKNLSPIRVPFLSDPNTQCAPYASMILSRNRKNILRGSVTISGNEFMQPGEVIYLEDRGLLFYVTAVRHNFSFGSSFTTTLDLTYGHSPGEYIPTTLDIIGKMIYNNRDVASHTIQRQSNSGNETNLGIVLRDKSGLLQFDTGDTSQSSINSFAAANTQTINNILYTSAYIINSNNTKGNNIQAKVQLRIYHDASNDPNSDLLDLASAVKASLTTDQLGPKQPFNKNTEVTNPKLNADDVDIVTVNMSDDNDRRSPSQKAIDAARNLLGNNSWSDGGTSLPTNTSDGGTGVISTGNSNKDVLRAALFGYIIDCWVQFENISSNTSGGS